MIATQETDLKLVQKPESQPEEGLGWKPDDDELALELVKTWKKKVAYFYSSWRVYEGGYWRTRTTNEVRRAIRQWLRGMRKSHGVVVSQGRIRALGDMMEDDLYVSDETLKDVQPHHERYVNVRNGLFNLETMELEPHNPDLYFTTQLDFDYDPDALCPTFDRYLYTSLVHSDGSPDRQLVELFCEALAYSMTARTDMKSSFWLVGQKDSGKSTAISILKMIMGNLHGTIDLTQLATNKFLLSGIVGKRVVTFTEASSSTVLPDALYKTITGGSDEIYADVKNRDAITFRPQCKLWWAMNEMPRIADRSGATTRRIIIIPFQRTIPESQRIADLEQRLAGERSGIFNLMVTYYIRLRTQGHFSKSKQSEQMREEYIAENDTEASFIEDCAEKHESYRVSSADLYAHYKMWCDTNGFKAKNINQVAKEWRRLGFQMVKSNINWWHGIRIKTFEIKK